MVEIAFWMIKWSWRSKLYRKNVILDDKMELALEALWLIWNDKMEPATSGTLLDTPGKAIQL